MLLLPVEIFSFIPPEKFADEGFKNFNVPRDIMVPNEHVKKFHPLSRMEICTVM